MAWMSYFYKACMIRCRHDSSPWISAVLFVRFVFWVFFASVCTATSRIALFNPLCDWNSTVLTVSEAILSHPVCQPLPFHSTAWLFPSLCVLPYPTHPTISVSTSVSITLWLTGAPIVCSLPVLCWSTQFIIFYLYSVDYETHQAGCGLQGCARCKRCFGQAPQAPAACYHSRGIFAPIRLSTMNLFHR